MQRGGAVVAYALVDPEDAHLARHVWRMHPHGYAQRAAESSHTTALLHRDVLGLVVGDGREVDHENRDKLDCRRSNLRIATHAQNQQNFSPNGNRTWRGRRTSSELRGVSWDARRRKWKATVTVNGHTRHLGRFDSEDEASAQASAFRAAHMPFAVN